jgi:hypothetical protein
LTFDDLYGAGVSGSTDLARSRVVADFLAGDDELLERELLELAEEDEDPPRPRREEDAPEE